MRRATQVWIIASLLLALGYPSSINPQAQLVATAAQPAALDSTSPITARAVELVGQNGGTISAVAVAGNYAYLAVGYGTSPSDPSNALYSQIVVLDINDPTHPVSVGRSERLDTHVTALLIDRGYLYTFGTSIAVLKLLTPERPVLVVTADLRGDHPLVVGRYLYVIRDIYHGGPGIFIIDISAPEHLYLAGQVAGMGINVLSSDGRYLYADGAGSLHVFDLANPLRPVPVGSYKPRYPPTSLALSGRYAYLFTGRSMCDMGCATDATLSVLDIAAPAHIQSLKDIDYSNNGRFLVYRMQVAGQRLSMGGQDPLAWEIKDLQQPAAPTSIGKGSGLLASVVGSRLFALDDGLHILDTADAAHPQELSSYQPSPVLATLALRDQVAYLSSRAELSNGDIAASGVIARISEPRWPVRHPGASFPFNEIAQVGNIGYVAGGDRPLTTLDLSNALQPVKRGELPSPDKMSLQRLAVAGRYAYVADDYGLRVLDLANPAKIVQVGWLPLLGWSSNLATAGSHVYYYYSSQAGDRLAVINIATPTNPTLVRSIVLPFAARHVLSLAANRLYVAGNGLRIFDLANPANPVLLGSLGQLLSAADMIVANGYAYIPAEIEPDNNELGLWVINIANPAQPAVTTVLDLPPFHSFSQLAHAGNRLYALTTNQIIIFDLAVPAAPKRLGIVDAPGIIDIVAQGNTLFMFHSAGHSIQTLDVTDPAHPSVIGDIPVGVSDFKALYSQGNFLYVVAGQSIRVVDRSNIRKLANIGAFVQLATTSGIAISGQYAYLTAGDQGLYIVNIADPAHPSQVGHTNWLGNANSIAVAGTYAYITTFKSDFWNRSAGLRVVDIANPANPVEVASIELPDAYVNFFRWSLDARDILIQGQYAYVAAGSGGVYVINISDPLHPTIVSKLATTAATKLALADNYLFVADRAGGLRVIDIASPARPVEVGAYATGNSITDVAAANGLIYTAGEDGLMVLRFLGVRLSPTVGWSLAYTDTQGLATTLAIPVGAVAQPTTLVFNPLTTVSPPDRQALAGHAFELTAYRNGAALPQMAFSKPISATVAYADRDLAVLSDKAALQLLGWGGGAWQDAASGCGGQQTHNRAGRLLRSPICRASSYGLFGPTRQTRLPLVRR